MFDTYWWVTTDLRNATLILGPYGSEEEANEAGYAKLDQSFNCLELPTRDPQKARDMVKAKRLGRMPIDNALQRARYKLPFERRYGG